MVQPNGRRGQGLVFTDNQSYQRALLIQESPYQFRIKEEILNSLDIHKPIKTSTVLSCPTSLSPFLFPPPFPNLNANLLFGPKERMDAWDLHGEIIGDHDQNLNRTRHEN